MNNAERRQITNARNQLAEIENVLREYETDGTFKQSPSALGILKFAVKCVKDDLDKLIGW